VFERLGVGACSLILAESGMLFGRDLRVAFHHIDRVTAVLSDFRYFQIPTLHHYNPFALLRSLSLVAALRFAHCFLLQESRLLLVLYTKPIALICNCAMC